MHTCPAHTAWNAVFGWFGSVIQKFNELDIRIKIGIGLGLLAVACIITAIVTIATGGTGTAPLISAGKMLLDFVIGVASMAAMSLTMVLINGADVGEAFVHGLADGIFWGGVFAFVSAGVSAVKATVRGIKNAKLAKSPQTGSQAKSCIGECFKAGTLVETEEGLKLIEEIEEGDKVLAYDEKTGEQAYKKVVRLFRNETEEWYHIKVNGEEIECTGGHPFYVVGEDKYKPTNKIIGKNKISRFKT